MDIIWVSTKKIDKIQKIQTMVHFNRPPVKSAQCVIGTEKHLDSGILLNYNDADYSQGYGQFKEAFRALTKDDEIRPNISDTDFRSSKNNKEIGYNLYVFDIRYQKKLESSQPIKVYFEFSQNVPTGIYGYGLVLTKKLVGISSNGQRHFDLI